MTITTRDYPETFSKDQGKTGKKKRKPWRELERAEKKLKPKR